MPTHLHIVYGCVPTTMAEFISCERDYIACKAQGIYYRALYQKNLPILA